VQGVGLNPNLCKDVTKNFLSDIECLKMYRIERFIYVVKARVHIKVRIFMLICLFGQSYYQVSAHVFFVLFLVCSKDLHQFFDNSENDVEHSSEGPECAEHFTQVADVCRV